MQLLAPITPHLTEEIYQTMFADFKEFESIQVSPWPEFNAERIDETAERLGDFVAALMSEVRRDKSEKRLSLNTPIKNLIIYAEDKFSLEAIAETKADIKGTLKVENLQVLSQKGEGREVTQYPTVHFNPEYGEKKKEDTKK